MLFFSLSPTHKSILIQNFTFSFSLSLSLFFTLLLSPWILVQLLDVGSYKKQLRMWAVVVSLGCGDGSGSDSRLRGWEWFWFLFGLWRRIVMVADLWVDERMGLIEREGRLGSVLRRWAGRSPLCCWWLWENDWWWRSCSRQWMVVVFDCGNRFCWSAVTVGVLMAGLLRGERLCLIIYLKLSHPSLSLIFFRRWLIWKIGCLFIVKSWFFYLRRKAEVIGCVFF